MSDEYTEVSHTSWFSRIMDSIKGILVGVVLIIVGVVVLFWNEGRAVKTAKGLEEGGKNVVTVAAATIDPANEGKLIHFTADAKSDKKVEDTVFKVAPGEGVVKLKRTVEMYQWDEKKETRTEKQLGGGEKKITTYKYNKIWSEKLIDSSKFNKNGYANPSSMPFNSELYTATPIKAGAFTLSEPLVKKLDDFQRLPIDSQAGVANDVKLHEGVYYKGVDPASPQVGDARITFSVVRGGPVSVYARQASGQLVAYPTSTGTELIDLRTGTHTAQAMIAMAQAENKMMTWILRLVGFIAVSLGFGLMLNPLVVVADVLPFLGSILGVGVFLAAVVLGAVVSSLTIAIAWLFYRPLLSIGLFAVVILLIYFIRSRGKARQMAMAGAPAMMPPPPPMR